MLFPGALGDLVLAMPALAGLRARHADAHLTLVVSGWLGGLAATSGVADAMASLDDADAAGLFGGTRLPAWMGRRPILYSWIGTRAPDVASRLRALAAEAHLFTIPRGDGPEHAAAVYAAHVGVDVHEPGHAWPPLAIGPRVEALLAAARRPLLAVHPGAGSVTKRWALDGFHDVAGRWRAAGGDVVELAGPAEEALAPLPDAQRAAGWPLVDVAGLLSRVDAYVGNDSGITHLAAAVGTPGVAIFGSTDPHRWAPRDDAMATLHGATWSPSGIPLDGVAPAQVWRALARRGCLDKLQGRT